MNDRPAFPVPGSTFTGLTIRDYFAAKAMQGIWANSEALVLFTKGKESAEIASVAYEQADAMLQERNK